MSSYHTAAWAKGLEKLCLTKLHQLGGQATARAVATALGKEMNLISPRFSALCAEGKVRDTGRRESVGRGRPLKVWAVCSGEKRDAVKPFVRPLEPAAIDDNEPAWFSRYGQ